MRLDGRESVRLPGYFFSAAAVATSGDSNSLDDLPLRQCDHPIASGVVYFVVAAICDACAGRRSDELCGSGVIRLRASESATSTAGPARPLRTSATWAVGERKPARGDRASALLRLIDRLQSVG